jgi:hypothetical protein
MTRNSIEDVTMLEKALTCMQSLRSFNYVGNPFEGTKKSRDYVLMMGLSIMELNLKNVMAHEREFLFKFHKIRQ